MELELENSHTFFSNLSGLKPMEFWYEPLQEISVVSRQDFGNNAIDDLVCHLALQISPRSAAEKFIEELSLP